MFAPSVVVGLLAKRFGIEHSINPTRQCLQLAARIAMVIEDGKYGDIDFENEEKLDCEESSDSTWDYDDLEESGDAFVLGGDDDVVDFNGKKITCAEVRTAISYRRDTKKGCRSLESMASRYRWIQKQNDINRLLKYEKAGEVRASRLVRLRRLAELVHDEVIARFDKGFSLHDVDLQCMAVRINKDFNLLDNFTASHSWIQRFKEKYGFCSRRITTFVTTKTLRSEDTLMLAATKHVEEMKSLLETTAPEAIVNCDQSGFNKELHGSRSLARIGEKTVKRVVQSTAATTHRFTILPILYASGRLGKKLYILMQEPSGQFPIRGHFTADKIEVRAAKSHIMRKEHMVDFLQSCFWDPADPKEMILMLDSWPSFRDVDSIQSKAPNGRRAKVVNIPPGTTSIVQPLDIYFFRPFKAFVKRVNQYVISQDIDFKISARDNILKVISQIYWLFCNPTFKEFLLYPWHSGGYLENHPGPFVTPADVCMPMGSYNDCKVRSCTNQGLIFCVYCNEFICFNCFFVVVHRC